jgi:hypothetical protein
MTFPCHDVALPHPYRNPNHNPATSPQNRTLTLTLALLPYLPLTLNSTLTPFTRPFELLPLCSKQAQKEVKRHDGNEVFAIPYGGVADGGVGGHRRGYHSRG